MDIESKIDSIIDGINKFFENIISTKPIAIAVIIAFVLIFVGILVWEIVSYNLSKKHEENERGWVNYREFLDLLDNDSSEQRMLVSVMVIVLVSAIQTIPALSKAKVWEYAVLLLILLVLVAPIVLRCFIFNDYFLIKKIRKRAHGQKIRVKDGAIITVDEWLEKNGLKTERKKEKINGTYTT